MNSNDELISLVVPLFNESAGLEMFNESLREVLDKHYNYEVIYCDDGSSDKTTQIVKNLCKNNPKIKLLRLSKNFGKEIATTAGIHHANGAAILTLDADGQHPVELIPEFINRWKAGCKVVVGLRTENQKEGFVKNFGSKLFYGIFMRSTNIHIVPGTTDFRLIDRSVQQEFKLMTERNRITRGLIDWLGFDKEYIRFKAKPRAAGKPTYSFKKLFKLAIDSVISLSISPLYITSYIGAVVLPGSLLLGLFMTINFALNDPFHIKATATAYLAVLLLFLVGVLLVSQGIIGLYLSHIHAETQNRPLYVIDKGNSLGISA